MKGQSPSTTVQQVHKFPKYGMGIQRTESTGGLMDRLLVFLPLQTLARSRTVEYTMYVEPSNYPRTARPSSLTETECELFSNIPQPQSAATSHNHQATERKLNLVPPSSVAITSAGRGVSSYPVVANVVL